MLKFILFLYNIENKMSKETFYLQPFDYCTSVISNGKPHSGKTYRVLKTLQYYFKAGVFDEYHLVIPCYYIEQHDSYGFLKPYVDGKVKGVGPVYIYLEYKEDIVKELLYRGNAPARGKQRDYGKIFFFMDDTTDSGNVLMHSPALITLATKSRHYGIMTWMVMHASKNVVPPNVRKQLGYLFLCKVKRGELKNVYEQWVDDEDFEEYDDFVKYYKQIMNGKHGCICFDYIHEEYESTSDW
jgi:hypothetical protein